MRFSSAVVLSVSLLLFGSCSAYIKKFDPEKFDWLGKEMPVSLCFDPCMIVTTRMPGPEKEFCACQHIRHRLFLKFGHYYRAGIRMQDPHGTWRGPYGKNGPFSKN